LLLITAFDPLVLSELLPITAEVVVRLPHRLLTVSTVPASAIAAPILLVKNTVLPGISVPRLVLAKIRLLEDAVHTIVAASTISAPVGLLLHSLHFLLTLRSLLPAVHFLLALRSLLPHLLPAVHLLLPTASILLLSALLVYLLLLITPLLLPSLLRLALLVTLTLHLLAALTFLLPTLRLLLTVLLDLTLLLPTLSLLLASLLVLTLLTLCLLCSSLLIPLLFALLPHLLTPLLLHLSLTLLLHLRSLLLHLGLSLDLLALLLPTRIASATVTTARVLRPLLLRRLSATSAIPVSASSAMAATLRETTARSKQHTDGDQ